MTDRDHRGRFAKTKGQKRSRSTPSAEHENCTICLDKLNGGCVQKLGCCAQVFHVECLKALHKAVCPLCRAPIKPSGSITKADVDTMRRREAELRATYNLQHVFAQIEHRDSLVVGSPEWIAGSRFILSSTSTQMLGARTFGVADEVFNQRVYEAILVVNPLFADTRRHRNMIYDLICDFVTITKPRVEYRAWPSSMTEWFVERLVTHSRKSEALHQAMHAQFPGSTCKDLRACCRDSLRILFTMQLASLNISVHL